MRTGAVLAAAVVVRAALTLGASLPAAPYCPKQHSCAEPQLPDRGCACDAACSEYGDCCRDSPHYDTQQQATSAASHICAAGPTPAYMKTSCPAGWGDQAVRERCLQGSKILSARDVPFPVTSTATAHTYVNRHCAICNGEQPARLHDWLVRLQPQAELRSCPAGRHEDRRIVFHEGRLGYMLPSCGLSSFTPCALAFQAPEHVKNYTRPCNPELVATCGSAVADERQRVLCQSYAATVYGGGLAFRNQHCAACNGHDQYECVRQHSDVAAQLTPSAQGGTDEGRADCRRVLLHEGELVRQRDGSVHVPAEGRTFRAREYEEGEGGVLVCRHNFEFPAELRWVSNASLSVSCLALALHLAAFCLAPSLRNLSGKCLASMCVALMAACAAMLVSAPVGGAGCAALATARYYSWLCCFAWMTTMALDVWHGLRQVRVAGGAKPRRFVAYSLCCWLVPAACAALAVVLDWLQPRGVPKEFLPGLGHSKCWFSHPKCLLVFFYVPAAVCTALNVLLFVSTAVLIVRPSRGTGTAAASLQRQRFCAVARLAAVMGLTWVSAFLAAHLAWQPLQYISAILNSLQGVFIFLAFTCKSKVLQEVRDRALSLLQRAATLNTTAAPAA